MFNLEHRLRLLTAKWRMAGSKTRIVAVEIPNLLARGHMHGLSDGLDLAADDVDELLDAPPPVVGPLTSTD